MKTIIKITAVLSLFLVSCSSLQTTSSIDDLYYSPKIILNPVMILHTIKNTIKRIHIQKMKKLIIKSLQF